MLIKRGKRLKLLISVLEIFVLINLSFAISFALNGSLVSARFGVVNGHIQSVSSDFTGKTFASAEEAMRANRLAELGGTPIGTGAGAAKLKALQGYEFKPLGVETGLKGATGHLAAGLTYALVAYSLGKMLGGLFGFEEKQSNALGAGLAAGVFTYKGIAALQAKGAIGVEGFLGSNQLLLSVGVAVVVFALLYKKESQKVVTFQCLPYEPPLGGAKCEECNKDPFRPCSEYRCKSLGQACELLNKGTSNEQCAWVSKFDVSSPVISPSADVLSPNGLAYVPDNAIRPPALGFKIQKQEGGCLQAFTPLQFGINTNEPSQCKIDYTPGNVSAKGRLVYDSMQFYFGENNLYSYNHTQKIKLPSPSDIQVQANSNQNGAPVLANDGTFSLYVRCQDANGNVNDDVFVVSYCVDKGPDTTPPVIQNSSIISGSPVRYQVDTVPIDLFVNEPVECKWSSQDKAYADMENSMKCNGVEQINSDLTYTCAGNLTGVKDRQDNNFYFRCKDQPGKADSERNTNVQSYKLLLKGSQNLNIINLLPNGTLYGSTSSVDIKLQVETSNGADSGKAICYFSPDDNLDNYIPMFSTNSFKHEQTLSLVNGDYSFYFRCIDAGGNTAASNTTFKVLVDKQAPKITRVYREGTDAIKFVTDEEAECVYSLNSCNYDFSNGLKMIYNPPSNMKASFAEWKPSSKYYVKCKDKYENQPEANSCSIIVNAIQLA